MQINGLVMKISGDFVGFGLDFFTRFSYSGYSLKTITGFGISWETITD